MKTITTVEQLEALPDRAVIKAADKSILVCLGHSPLKENIWQDEEARWWGSHDVELPSTLLHPLVFTAEDVEQGARKMNEDEWACDCADCLDVCRDNARAALGAVGSVE